MKHLRWAVVGLGIGQVHAATVASLEDASLVALCDQDSAVLERVAAQFPNAELYTDFDDLVENCEIDALVIATYDDSHAKLAAAALKRGIHVFVEKPLAATQEDLLEIAALLNSDPALRLSSNTLLRLSPRFAWLKSRIATGSLGRIYHAELSYLYGRLEKVADGWRGKSPAYSVTLGGTIHMIDLLLWLTGERPEQIGRAHV